MDRLPRPALSVAEDAENYVWIRRNIFGKPEDSLPSHNSIRSMTNSNLNCMCSPIRFDRMSETIVSNIRRHPPFPPKIYCLKYRRPRALEVFKFGIWGILIKVWFFLIMVEKQDGGLWSWNTTSFVDRPGPVCIVRKTHPVERQLLLQEMIHVCMASL